MEMQLTEPRRAAIPGVKLVAGIFFALLGLVMTLDNLDVIDGERVIRYWPIVLIVVGLIKLSDQRDRLLAIVAIAIGSLLLAGRLHLLHFSIGELWPLILIVAGLGLVGRSLGWNAHGNAPYTGKTIWAVLSKFRESSVSQDYTGGRIVAFMGGCELDLSGAEIGEGPAVLEVVATWGAIIIRVPSGWEVIDEAIPIMGAIDIRTDAARGGRRLIIRGLALMGGVEVKTAKVRTV